MSRLPLRRDLLIAAARAVEGTRLYPAGNFARCWRDTPALWTWLSLDPPANLVRRLDLAAAALVLAPVLLLRIPVVRRG